MEIKRTRAAAECAAVDERAAARGLLRLETGRRGRREEGGDCAHRTNSLRLRRPNAVKCRGACHLASAIHMLHILLPVGAAAMR
jgi:hypothetical protein